MKRLLLAAALLLATPLAEAKQVHFASAHPIPAAVGGGYCYLDAGHVHIYEPAEVEVLYRATPEGYFFVGDPVPFGYEGPKFTYYGPHPVATTEGHVEYDYLEGPHYHEYAPPPSLEFKAKADVYYYVGEYPQVYVQQKPRFAKINVFYKPHLKLRPVVVEAPPVEYHGPVVEIAVVTPPLPRAEVVVDAPAVVVVPPRPPAIGISAGVSLDVNIGGGLVIGGGGPRAVVVHDRPSVVKYKPGKKIKFKSDRGRHRGHGKKGRH